MMLDFRRILYDLRGFNSFVQQSAKYLRRGTIYNRHHLPQNGGVPAQAFRLHQIGRWCGEQSRTDSSSLISPCLQQDVTLTFKVSSPQPDHVTESEGILALCIPMISRL
jgi:hypothetical protein